LSQRNSPHRKRKTQWHPMGCSKTTEKKLVGNEMSLDPKLLQELNSLIALDPEKARKVFAEHPELTRVVYGEIHKEDLAAKVRAEDSPESFFAFCELLDGEQPPAHTQRQVRKMYEDHAKGTGTVNLAFRGSRKTTYFGVKFVAYRVGKEPHKTNVAIGANDDSPQKVVNSVSVIIESHPEWKRAFPNVVPDKDRGWSVEGYYVKDTSMQYEEWVKKQVSTVDPTIIGGGYNSTRINGKHPTGILYIDDIHDINNNSDTQRKDVVKKLTTVILKTVIRVSDKLSTWVLGIGVPWASDDGYQTMVNAGYGFIQTPAMRKAVEGEGVYIDGYNPATKVTYEDITGWWVLTWPENFGTQAIIQERSFGKSEFWQMIMLDLATASTGKLIYHQFPADQIDLTWPVLGGADPTSFDQTLVDKKSSSFALGVAAKRPVGGLIVIDGVLEQCTMLQAENYILSFQSRFSNWLFTAVENVGVGKIFIQSLMRNALLRIVPSGLKGISDGRVRGKKDRILVEVAPLLENGDVLLSDADTPYLNALRRLFNHFYDLSEHDPAWDAGDSLYHIIKSAPDALRKNDDTARQNRRQRGVNPLKGIGSWVGY
jgi:hypothetical protein